VHRRLERRVRQDAVSGSTTFAASRNAGLLFGERGGRVHQLGEVLDAVGAFALVLVVLAQAAARPPRLSTTSGSGRLWVSFRRSSISRLNAAACIDRLKQRDALLLRRILQLLDAARADAARRELTTRSNALSSSGRGDQRR